MPYHLWTEMFIHCITQVRRQLSVLPALHCHSLQWPNIIPQQRTPPPSAKQLGKIQPAIPAEYCVSAATGRTMKCMAYTTTALQCCCSMGWAEETSFLCLLGTSMRSVLLSLTQSRSSSWTQKEELVLAPFSQHRPLWEDHHAGGLCISLD